MELTEIQAKRAAAKNFFDVTVPKNGKPGDVLEATHPRPYRRDAAARPYRRDAAPHPYRREIRRVCIAATPRTRPYRRDVDRLWATQVIAPDGRVVRATVPPGLAEGAVFQCSLLPVAEAAPVGTTSDV